MKTTIIKILDKIANGEEVPKRIKYLGHIYNYDYEDVCYYDGDKQDLLEFALFNCKYTAVNETVEILDEPKEDKIDKIDVAWQNVFAEQSQQDFAKMTLNKINEIIDRFNNLEV